MSVTKCFTFTRKWRSEKKVPLGDLFSHFERTSCRRKKNEHKHAFTTTVRSGLKSVVNEVKDNVLEDAARRKNEFLVELFTNPCDVVNVQLVNVKNFGFGEKF